MTTPEDFMDDIFDSGNDPTDGDSFLPDEGKYTPDKITFSRLDPRKSGVSQSTGQPYTIGAQYRVGISIKTGPTQVKSGKAPDGRVLFGEVPVPGGDFQDPKYELRGDFTSIEQVRTADKQRFRRLLDALGWTAEHGFAFTTDPNVFMGLTFVEGTTVTVKHYVDNKGETRYRLYINPPKK